MKTIRHKILWVVLAVFFTGVCALLFNSFYKEAQNSAITRLNDEQMIHARQAARGIQDFIAMSTRSLDSLAKMDGIIDIDAGGRRNMELFHEANQEQIRAITRMDERGIIIHNSPSSRSAGSDISDQKHVRELLRNHQPVISDVFKSVEGYDAIALHVPVFKGAEFKGSIGILIDFRNLAHRYLDLIRIGESGYAWVVSRDGTILYTPIPGLAGKSVFDVIQDSPSLRVMANAMIEGKAGVATYTYDRIRDRNVGLVRKYAVYMPVPIGNTYWSIAVASAEQDVLSGLISFRNKLAWITACLFICGMVFSTLGVKAWMIVKEEDERKWSEEKLRESEAKYRILFDRASDGIILMTTNGQLVSVNESFARMHGYSVREMLAMSLRDLDTPGSFEGVPDRMRRMLAGEALTFEVHHYHKDGHVFPLEVSASRITTGGKDFIQCFHRDITARKQAEAELQERQTELAHLSRVTLLGELSGSLAHELNQPLTAILSNAQAAQRYLAQDPPDLTEVREILADIVSEDEHAVEVIRHLRLLLAKGEVQRQLLDANDVVLEVLKLVRGDLTNHGVMVTTRLAPNLAAIRGDRVQLQQVLLNLVMNACDAMASNENDDRHLTLVTRTEEDGGLRIEVGDVGHGLPEGGAERAFERFFTTKPHGLGLGLSVCRTIITAHGGTLGASNKTGRGATFYCTLPAGISNQ